MSKIFSSFILFHLAIAIFCAQMGPKDIKIPSEYVTDKDFIDMIFKDSKSETTVYASPSGSGSKCTESAPCTLHHAVENKLKKGVRLYLKGGKYDVKSGVSINHSGSANLYIVISSAPNEKAIITSSKDGQVGLFEISGSYIIIENLTFENVRAKNVQGIVFYGGGQHHVIIRNNIFHNLRTTKVDEDHGANGILLNGRKG